MAFLITSQTDRDQRRKTCVGPSAGHLMDGAYTGRFKRGTGLENSNVEWGNNVPEFAT